MGFAAGKKWGGRLGLGGAALVVALWLPLGAAADPFSLTGNWNYRQNGGDESETTKNFNQAYQLNFDKQLSALMNLSASSRYNDNQLSPGSDSSSINPSLAFDVRNELFSLNLNAAESRIDVEDRPEFVNQTWGANFYTQLENWPGLRLYYNESSNRDDQREHDQDDKSSLFGASVDYALGAFDMLYDFSSNQSEDFVQDITSDTLSHFAQLKYSESFFRDRLSVGMSQQYSQTTTETESPVAADGTFLEAVPVLEGFSGLDNSPQLGPLASNPALNDRNLQNSSGVVIAQSNEMQNVGVQVSRQRVSQLEVIFDREILDGDWSNLRWSVYQSSDNNLWQLLDGNAVPRKDRFADRTHAVIAFPETIANYLKVVIEANLNLIEPVAVTEIEAGVRRVATGDRGFSKSRFTSHQTQISVSYRPTPIWAVGYSMRRVLNLPSEGADNTQTTHSVYSSYNPSRYFGMALAASENRDNSDGMPTDMSRSYSLAFNSSPLPTLDLSLGYTRTHNYEGGDETSQSDQVNATVTAEIYTDLTVGFTPTWIRTEDLETGGRATTHGFTLIGNMRINPRMSLTGNWDYARTSTEGSVRDEAKTTILARQYGLTLNYRPSDVLLLTTSLRRDVDEDDTALSGNLAWLVTRNLQANAGASYSLSDDDSEQYNAALNWSLSQNLSLQGSGGYQVADGGDTWNLGTSLNANY